MCRKSQETQKEMKLVLDVYKGAAKDLRDKVEVHVCTCNLFSFKLLLFFLSIVAFFSSYFANACICCLASVGGETSQRADRGAKSSDRKPWERIGEAQRRPGWRGGDTKAEDGWRNNRTTTEESSCNKTGTITILRTFGGIFRTFNFRTFFSSFQTNFGQQFRTLCWNIAKVKYTYK